MEVKVELTFMLLDLTMGTYLLPTTIHMGNPYTAYPFDSESASVQKLKNLTKMK